MPDKHLQIFGVCLWKDRVDETSSTFGSFTHKRYVVRCNKYHRQPSDMRGKSVACFPIDDEFFFSVFPQDAHGLQRSIVHGPIPVDPETLTTGSHRTRVAPWKITFREAQIVDRIQQIRLPNAIGSAKCNNPVREIEMSVRVVTELGDWYLSESQHWNISHKLKASVQIWMISPVRWNL